MEPGGDPPTPLPEDAEETAANVLRDIGRRVAEVRATRGWTQETTAERLDVNLPYFQRIEAGRENLTVRSLVSVARVLGVRTAVLFTAPVSRARRGPGRPKRRRASDPQDQALVAVTERQNPGSPSKT